MGGKQLDISHYELITAKKQTQRDECPCEMEQLVVCRR